MTTELTKEANTIHVHVVGPVGCGKSAMAGEIEILCKALGLNVSWPDGQSEKNMVGADWQHALEMYKPSVVIHEALTQRPAAQTEREAFEAWARPNGYDLRRNDVLGHYSSIDTSRAWSGFRAGRASLPAPQQATPAQDSKGAAIEASQQATPEPCKDDVALALAAAQQSYPNPGEPEAGWCLLERKHVEALCRAARKATPEPVGEPFGWWFTEDPEVFSMPGSGFRRYPNKPQHTVECIPLYTRPAPGVPDVEDLRDRLVAISAAVADSDDRAAQAMLGEILRALAAAQAKGGEQ